MNRHVNAIAGRLSLRPPQRRSLEILDRISDLTPPKKGVDVAAALGAIGREFPSVTDFERDFPSVCFALATGVGKTRLMGAFISYLRLAHGIRNFFVLAPSLTIYNKLITDFTPNTSKYVFTGIAEFATEAPTIITGDTYDKTLIRELDNCKINIFNISKINSEVRGGKAPRIKRLSEYIGESYFDYLSGLDDLVLIMDESHRYRASAGVRAINELKPVLGLELTATPQVEAAKGPVRFKNVIYDYPLSNAMADGFVKEPAVVTRKDFNPSGMSSAEIERLKLEDGVRLHEIIKVQLETYARETSQRIVKPFVLVIARDTTHAGGLKALIESDGFFEGRYASAVIQVDSSRTGAEEDEMVQRLLAVERPDEPTEIVIHVNMLKEGWDVTNLYTIVPLRAANARTLVEQSIGRGLRLPYGKRTRVTAVDRLNIIAHDRFQDLVDEANKPDSVIRLQSVVLDPAELATRLVTVVSQSNVDRRLGISPVDATPATQVAGTPAAPLFTRPEEQRVARAVHEVVRELQDEPGHVPSASYLARPEIQTLVADRVRERLTPDQLALGDLRTPVDLFAITAQTVDFIAAQTIDIPKILVQPRENARSGFQSFTLDLTGVKLEPPSEELWIQHLRTREAEVIGLGAGGIEERRLEDFVVRGLVDFNDVAYDDHADLLYDLAGQVVRHLLSYLPEDQARRVLRMHQRELAALVHVQMQSHRWEEKVDYEVRVTKGFSDLKESNFSARYGDPVLDFRRAPEDKSNMARYLFGGFERYLFSVLRVQSDPERRMAVILDRDSLKWFKPAKSQFQIYYKLGNDQPEYQPDFVAETDDVIYMIEVKARNEMESAEVLEKKRVATLWCERASAFTRSHGGKWWRYALIPHDVITENMSLAALAVQ